jgi:hypothetical protein
VGGRVLTVATAARPARPPAITTPALDVLLSGGLSIAVVLALLAVRPGFEHDRLNRDLVLWSALVNWPHFMASFGLLYGSRERVREHRFASLGFPPLLVLASVGVTVSAAWTQVPLELATLLTSAYLAWHYTGQAFGMIVAFGHVEGRPLADNERGPIRFALRMLLAYHVSWIHYLFPAGIFPGAMVQAFELANTVLLWAMPVALAVGVSGLVRYSRRIGRLPPLRVVVPFAAVHLWYVLLAVEPGALVIVQLSHALQYLVFPLRVRLNGYAEGARTRGEAPTRAGQLRYASLYYAGLLASGVAVLYALPQALESVVGSLWGLAVPAAAAGVCVQMIVNVHHYLTDAVIWRQRDPRVRRSLFGHLG